MTGKTIRCVCIALLAVAFACAAMAQRTGHIEVTGRASWWEAASCSSYAAAQRSVLCADAATHELQLSNASGSFSGVLTRAIAAAIYAPLASPTFTGDPKAPSPAAGDSDTSIPNTAWVQSESLNQTEGDARYLRLAGGAMSGAVTSTSTFTVGGTTLAAGATFQVNGASNAVLRMAATSADSNATMQLSNDAQQWQLYVDGSGADMLRWRNATAGRNDVGLDTSGNLLLTGVSALTAGTMTLVTNAAVKAAVTRAEWTNAMVVALGAVTAGDVAVVSLPARTVVRNAYVVITSAAGSVTTLTVSLGRFGAAYTDYIAASDAKAAPNSVYGDGSAERGASLTGFDVPSYSGTTTLFAHFVSTGGNLSTVTNSSGVVYVETVTLP